MQHLSKIRHPDKRIGRNLHAHTTELHEFAPSRQGIGLGYEQDQITISFGPDVCRQIAIADWHGIIFIVPKRCPGHVVFSDELIFPTEKVQRQYSA
jgi:hypothetical protein